MLAGLQAHDWTRKPVSQDRLIVQDRQRFFREALTELLAANAGCEALEPVDTGPALLALAIPSAPTFVILEVGSIPWDAAEMIKRLRGLHPDIRILGTTPAAVGRTLNEVPVVSRRSPSEAALAILAPRCREARTGFLVECCKRG